MTIKHIAARLFVLPQKRRKRGNVHLTFWLLILGITFTSVFALSVQPAHAQSLTTTQQTKAEKSTAYAIPMQPKDCSPDDATCLANGDGKGNPGQVKSPLGDNPLMFFTDPNLTVGQDGVVKLWQGGIAIVDVIVVLLIALNGIRIMVSGSIFRYADVVETIPRILVSLIAAHMSLVLAGVILGLNNTLCSAFFSFAQGVTLHTSHLPKDFTFSSIFSDAFKSIMGNGSGIAALGSGLMAIGGSILSALPGVGGVLGAVLKGASGVGKVGLGVTMAFILITELPRILLQLVALIMTTMLFAQMIVRLLLIDFYIVIAGPCIACSGLPGRSGQPVTNFWLKGIITTILAQAMQVVGVIISQILFDSIFDLVNSKLPGFLNGDNVMHGVNLVQLVVYIAMLWFIMRLPTLFSLNPSTQMIAAGGQMVSGAAAGVAGAVGGAGQRAINIGGAGLIGI